jgi:tetratricopeptide (TPR) repeat protein
MQKTFRIFMFSLFILVSCQSGRERAIGYVKQSLAMELRHQNDSASLMLDKAIAADPTFAPAWYYKGNSLFNKKDIKGAIADYTKAIELKPDFADAYANRGEAYFSDGSHDKACLDYLKAEKLGKTNMYEKTKWCK